MEFDSHVRAVAQKIREIPDGETVRVISHFDCDGICAAAIFVKTLLRSDRSFSLSFVPHLDEDYIRELACEDYNYYFFLDLGSGILDLFDIIGKTVFVIDHHEISGSGNVIHLNPHLVGVDGSKEISGSGVVYFLANELDPLLEMAHIALIGAIGDSQEQFGFTGLNEEIFKWAVKEGGVRRRKGLRIFGNYTKPLHKVLQHSVDPYIPGVSKSERGAINFLNSLKIPIRKGGRFFFYDDLSSTQEKKLIEAVIERRSNEEKPSDVYGYTYVNPEETVPVLQDLREFSTVMNACGRLMQASVGYGACLGSKYAKKRAVSIHQEYKGKISEAMAWFEEDTGIISEKGYVIANAKEKILSTLIGTVASIISYSADYPKNTFIMTLARCPNGRQTKISLRQTPYSQFDLREIISEIVNEGFFGGHRMAAGALIPVSEESQVIEQARRVFEKYSLEESL
ncbi:MAG: DHH family phosphoesterase [Candidatus Woesearchaeota archaeon]